MPSGEKWRGYRRDYYRRKRLAAIAALGGKCVRCGYDTDHRALQLDHIGGGGTKRTRAGLDQALTTTFLLQIIRGERPDIQLLCANCNMVKRADERGYWK